MNKAAQNRIASTAGIGARVMSADDPLVGSGPWVQRIGL